MFEMNGDTVARDDNDDSSRENQQYSRSSSDHQISDANKEDRGTTKHLPRSASGTPGTFSVIYEVPTDADEAGITFAPPPSASSANFQQHQQQRRSTGTGPFERQLSIIDPTSDRVSTVLVWKDIIVSTRKKQFCRNPFAKGPPPTAKRLLHKVSGAITGGLWAVMGKSFFFLSIYIYCSHCI